MGVADEKWSRGDELTLRLLLIAGPLLMLLGYSMDGAARGVATFFGCGMFVIACICKAMLLARAKSRK